MLKPNILQVLAVVFFVLFASGCAAKRSASASESAPAGALAVGGAPSPTPNAERSRIVTMDVSITVEHFDDSLARLRASIEGAGGYVSDMHMHGDDEEQGATVELRVPANRAQDIRTSLGGLGQITSQNEKVEDVTEQRADLDARIASSRVQEKRLLEIMANRSGTISDLVENEKELARVRENIERLEAQQRSLVSKVDLATIHVTLTSRSVPAWKTPASSLAKAGHIGVNGAQAFFTYAGMVFLTLAPTMLPICAVIFGLVVAWRRRRASQLAALAG